MFEVWAMMVRHIIITIIAIVINFKEESKEGKSSNYNFQDDGHNSSGPVVHVWLHEGSIPTSKIADWG